MASNPIINADNLDQLPRHVFHGFTELPVGYMERAHQAKLARAAIMESTERVKPGSDLPAATIDIIQPDQVEDVVRAQTEVREKQTKK